MKQQLLNFSIVRKTKLVIAIGQLFNPKNCYTQTQSHTTCTAHMDTHIPVQTHKHNRKSKIEVLIHGQVPGCWPPSRPFESAGVIEYHPGAQARNSQGTMPPTTVDTTSAHTVNNEV